MIDDMKQIVKHVRSGCRYVLMALLSGALVAACGGGDGSQPNINLPDFEVGSDLGSSGLHVKLDEEFLCGGPVYEEANFLWQNKTKFYVKQKLQEVQFDRNTVALYETTQHVFSFNEMIRRCGDADALEDVVATLLPFFDELEGFDESGYDDQAVGWLNGSGEEIKLYSVQYLGLVGAVATNILETIPESQRNSNEKMFIQKAVDSMAHQINRWLVRNNQYELNRFSQLLSMSSSIQKPYEDVATHHFRLFNDKDLWYLTVLSDLSELDQAGISKALLGQQGLSSLKKNSQKINNIFNVFVNRLSYFDTADGPRADIDVGFRRYDAEPYSWYTNLENPPALCVAGKTEVIVDMEEYSDPEITWDFSHARRFPVALETFVRNRDNLRATFGYERAEFNPIKIRNAFINQIIHKIWQRDPDYPLFKNYWNGDNGYITAGDERISEGASCDSPLLYKPFAHNRAFADGHFTLWGLYNADLRELAERVYQLMRSRNRSDQEFMENYYLSVGHGDSDQLLAGVGGQETAQIWRINFLSDLVGVNP